MVPSDAPPLSFAIVPGVGPAVADHWRASWQQSSASSTAHPDRQRRTAASRASAPTALCAGLPILVACGSLQWRGRGRQRHAHGSGARGLLAEGHRWLRVLLRAQANEEQLDGQPASGSHSTAKEEVLQQLRNIVDEGLSTDIVTAGFVSSVEADAEKGFISLHLEVSMFEDAIRTELKKIPWARSFEVHVMAPQGPPPTQPPPLPVPPSLRQVKSIIAVSSCKGGVGKSAVAVNLAYELQKSGAKVGIFDCDIYGPSLPVMVKVPGPAEMEMYMDENEEKHIVPLVDPASGVKLVSFGYVGALAMMRGSIITSLIVQLLSQTDWGELDYLVLDMPPGTGDIHLTLAQTCKITAAVIVTTPQRLSIIDVERGISMFRKLGVPSLAVVQNMSYYTGVDGKRMFPFGKTTAGSELAEAFQIDHVFEIPIDSSVSAGGDSGVPFVSTSSGVPAQVMAELAGVVRTKVDGILAKSAPRMVSPFEEVVKEKV